MAYHVRSCHLVLILLAACGRHDVATTYSPRIDTLPGGIVRVVNGGPSEWVDTNGWKLVLERRILSVDSGAALLGSPRNLVVDAAGEIIVLDRKPALIKVFGLDGALRRTIGRQGEGPGEYGDYGDLWIVGDTLIVNDGGNRRMVLFTLDGRHLRTVRGARGRSSGRATSDNKLGVVDYLAHPPTSATDYYAGRGVRWYRTDGTVADSSFFPSEAKPSTWSLVDATHDLGVLIPFAPERVQVLNREGQLIWGEQDRYRLIVAAHGRDTVRIVEAMSTPVPIPDSLRRSELADVLKGSAWAATIAKLEEIPVAYPLWTDITIDEAGDIWVLRRSADPGRAILDVFSPEGVLRGSVAAPFATFEYSWWTRDRVYRIGESGEGDPVIEVWRVERRVVAINSRRLASEVRVQ